MAKYAAAKGIYHRISFVNADHVHTLIDLSVSQSGVAEVSRYIANQTEHHRTKTFAEEYRAFVQRYGLTWRDEETVQTVSASDAMVIPAINRGVNEKGASTRHPPTQAR